jgi:hypothetical protein
LEAFSRTSARIIATCRRRAGAMEWDGDADAFARAALREQDADAFARGLRSVPPAAWPAVEARLRGTFDRVELVADAAHVPGRVPTEGEMSADLGDRRGALAAKKSALHAEDRARRGGAARPA